MTVAKVKHMSSRKFLNRKNELFTRLTPSNLHELLLEYEHDACEDASTAARFGVGASDGGPRIVEHQAEAAPVYDRPYLLLDVRPYAEYRKCHLMQARSFPVLNLTQDVQTAELLQCVLTPPLLLLLLLLLPARRRTSHPCLALPGTKTRSRR